MPAASPRLPDPRYSVAREYCGYPTPRHVARFCGDWLGQSATRAGALAIARAHHAVRRARIDLAQAEADLALALARGA
ncbi:hypothetical protein [Sphingomonas oryzagri]